MSHPGNGGPHATRLGLDKGLRVSPEGSVMDGALRSRRWQLLACAITVVMLAGCGGASSPSGTPLARITPRPETPTPEPGPWSSGWPVPGHDARIEVELRLFDACYAGKPVPGAAPYAGKVHPLVVFDMNNGWVADVDINQDFLSSGWPWPSPIQLVVCSRSEEKTVASCGTYKTEAGEVGEVVRYQDTMTLRVIVAQTGKALQEKVLKNPAPKCPKSLVVPKGFEWNLKNPVTAEQVNTYATAVSE